MEDIVYFELNNWFAGRDYPDEEPFASWMGRNIFENEKWVKENRLCVVAGIVDMSQNFCVTAPREWVERLCPKLLTEHRNFLRHPDEDGDVYGQFDHQFLPYTEENVGVTWVEEDD